MIKVVVYLSENYKISDTFTLNGNPTKEEIDNLIMEQYGDRWHYCDIWNIDKNGKIIIN